MFYLRVVSLSRLDPILKRQDLAFFLALLNRINVAQESCRGHACNGRSRNKEHYSNCRKIPTQNSATYRKH
jgi:hypothetical protein